MSKQFFGVLMLSALIWAPIDFVHAQASQEVVLHFNHKLGDASFALNSSSTHMGYDFSIKRLQYYVSDIAILHDGGQVTPVEDTWLLVDASTDVEFSLGSFDVGTMEGLRFGIGVDPATNHLDPASYPLGNPLAHQFPSMHWGWLSGYRFMAIEGYAGAGLATLWEIHALGDANYRVIDVMGEAVVVGDQQIFYLEADYREALYRLDIAQGFLEHSESGHAVTLLDNMAELVFSRAAGPLVISGLEQEQVNAFAIYPNPSQDGWISVQLTQPLQADAILQVVDPLGRVLQQQRLGAGEQTISAQLSYPGLHTIQLVEGNQVIGQQRCIRVD